MISAKLIVDTVQTQALMDISLGLPIKCFITKRQKAHYLVI